MARTREQWPVGFDVGGGGSDCCDRFIESAAVVAEPEAFLAVARSRDHLWSRSWPRVRWFHDADVQVALEALDRAGKTREASLALAERENVGHDRTVAPDSTWSVEQATGQLIQRP